MNKELVTPLGEINIYIDNVKTDYKAEPCSCKVHSVREKPLAGSYRITISADNWQKIRCVAALHDTGIANTGASGERFLYSEFISDNVMLTIGAEDENMAFDTNRLRYGIEYVRKASINRVLFGIAWAADYEGPYDIRTQLAADLY